MKVFQEQLIKYRKKAGYESAKDFAESCNIPYQNYMNYENKGSEPKYEVLCRIAQKLGTSIDTLLGFNLNEYEYYKDITKKNGFVVIETDDNNDDCTGVIINGIVMDKTAFVNIIKNALENSEKISNHLFTYAFRQEIFRILIKKSNDRMKLIDKILRLSEESNMPKETLKFLAELYQEADAIDELLTDTFNWQNKRNS